MDKVSIRFYKDHEVRAVWDDAQNKWWFSVLDVVGAINEQDDHEKNRNYWKYLKAKLKKEQSEVVSDTTQLKLTAAGRRFMANPEPFLIVLDTEFTDDDVEESHEGGMGALDNELYMMLRDLRKKVAKKLKLPPYVIFQDMSLEQMATMYPVTEQELQNIQGVGAGKAKRYGKEFLQLIKRHCKLNDIERPEELRVRTVAKRSMQKVKIIQGIDHEIPLDDIATAEGIDFDELLTKVDEIVYSGTKLNIDYFIEEVVDDDHVEDIYDYFTTSETDDLDTAQRALGPEYNEDEIRLVRIKFMSEMAN